MQIWTKAVDEVEWVPPELRQEMAENGRRSWPDVGALLGLAA